MSPPAVRTALITTTIYVPEVLARYRELGPDVSFIVAGDRKTPHKESRQFVDSLGNALYLSDEDQEKLGYKSSEVIGWNKIMRRNIALLEAIKGGFDVIVTVDDDNIPVTEDYFDTFARLLGSSFSGVSIGSNAGWLNAGDFLQPAVYHRGFPYEFRHRELDYEVDAVSDARIGVAAGLWLGDPDIDAMERLINRPTVTGVDALAQAGFVVRPGTWAPFNSQNTAYVRSLAPLMMVLVGVGRFDDIFASYIAQRIGWAAGYVLHFGPPIVYQDRNEQSLWRNLRDELYGMEKGLEILDAIDSADVTGVDVLEDLRSVYRNLRRVEHLPPVVHELGTRWCADVERCMATVA
jgi:hypothetical protein